jgi:hypothetical protein
MVVNDKDTPMISLIERKYKVLLFENISFNPL